MIKSLRKKFIGDRNFYRRVLMLAIPMIVQNAITSFVSFLDNIMVGQIGTEQMSGVAIVNQLLFVFNIAIFGSVSGAGIFSTQFFGKGDYEGQKHAFRFKVYASLLVGIGALVLFFIKGGALISLYLKEGSDVGDITLALKFGKEYLSIMMVSLLPFAITQTYVSTIRETGQTFVPMVASVTAVLSNLALDYLLIFGKAGLPALGVKGAALATVIARFAELLIVVIWTHTHKAKNPYIKGVYASIKIPKKTFMDILIKGTPLMVNEFLWASGMAVISQCYSIRGLDVVAAQNISSTITNLFNIVYIQLGCSISVIVGQYLGAGRVEEAKDADRKMLFFNVAACMVMSVLMILLGRLFPAIYNTHQSVKDLAGTFILISALAMPLCSFTHSTYFTLRSGGKTLITFLFDSVYTWVLLIPFTYLLAYHTSLSIVSVFFLVQFSEIIKVIIGFFMVKSGTWAQNIVSK